MRFFNLRGVASFICDRIAFPMLPTHIYEWDYNVCMKLQLRWRKKCHNSGRRKGKRKRNTLNIVYKNITVNDAHLLSSLSLLSFLWKHKTVNPVFHSTLRLAQERPWKIKGERTWYTSVCIGDKWGCDKTKKFPNGKVERSSKELRQFGAGYVIRGTFGAGLFARLIKVSPGCLELRKSLLRSFTDYVRYFASIRT